MKYHQLNTPSLLIDKAILNDNLKNIQKYTKKFDVALRPYVTHKMPYISNLQLKYGAIGITVLSVDEAEVMASYGLRDVFITDEFIDKEKIDRILKLSNNIKISIGIKNLYQIYEINTAFSKSGKIAEVLIEINVEENSSCMSAEKNDFKLLLDGIRGASHISLHGIYSNDSHAYESKNRSRYREISLKAQSLMLEFSLLCQREGFDINVVSIGSNVSFVSSFEVLEGITEIRSGTYALMDVAQSNVVGTYHFCAATVLATVLILPTPSHVILDVVHKGILLDFPNVYIQEILDGYALVENEAFRKSVKVGDKVRIIPIDICEICNFYENATLFYGENIYKTIPILSEKK